MKKIILITLTALLLFSLCLTASADFGSGVFAISEASPLIKTGLLGKKLTFSDKDIKQGLCISDFDSITITKIPSSEEGALILMGRRVAEGQTIKRKNIAALVFIPRASDTERASFKFTVSPYESSGEFEFILKYTDKINYEPTISSESIEIMALTTQRDVENFGRLYANDPEDDEVEFIILSYPKGNLILTDKTTGKYKYTPTKSYVGEDEFTYVARDEWGNYSKPATVTVTVAERVSEAIFEDMKGRGEYNDALTVSSMGIMSGSIMGDGMYFMPDVEVTRAEFVAMVMKCMGIRRDSTLIYSHFDDNDEIPIPLVEYIATAERCGIINGSFEGGRLLFKPNEKITRYEAAAVIAKVKNLKCDVSIPTFSESGGIPLSKRAAVMAMYEYGYFSDELSFSDLKNTLSRAECASLLVKIMK